MCCFLLVVVGFVFNRGERCFGREPFQHLRLPPVTKKREIIIITESPAVLKLFMLLDFYYKEELKSDFSLLLANPHEDNALRRVSNRIAPV